MAWGYEKCFTIEHDSAVKRRIDCKDCLYYERMDKSCNKRPLYLPVDGYNSWRNCNYFELDSSTSNYEAKKVQYADVLKRRIQKQAIQLKTSQLKATQLKVTVPNKVTHETESSTGVKASVQTKFKNI